MAHTKLTWDALVVAAGRASLIVIDERTFAFAEFTPDRSNFALRQFNREGGELHCLAMRADNEEVTVDGSIVWVNTHCGPAQLAFHKTWNLEEDEAVQKINDQK